MSLSIGSTVRQYPTHPYKQIKVAILGSRYNLSLVFVGAQRARTLNQLHRHKDYTPNVLSFPLDEQSGEIYLCPLVAKKEACRYHLTTNAYVAYLFIHGCLHLKGHEHGDTMDKLEQKWTKFFKLDQ